MALLIQGYCRVLVYYQWAFYRQSFCFHSWSVLQVIVKVQKVFLLRTYKEYIRISLWILLRITCFGIYICLEMLIEPYLQNRLSVSSNFSNFISFLSVKNYLTSFFGILIPNNVLLHQGLPWNSSLHTFFIWELHIWNQILFCFSLDQFISWVPRYLFHLILGRDKERISL